jgi:hypothetical protein
MGLAIFGAILGASLGVVATLVLVPALQLPSEYLVARFLGGVPWRRTTSLAGEWSERWWEDADSNPNRWEHHGVRISQFADNVTADFIAGYDRYRMIGQIDRGLFLSGTWHNVYGGNKYHGTFQLRVYPDGELMRGRWIGWGSANDIKSGSWEWKRSWRPDYLPLTSLPP